MNNPVFFSYKDKISIMSNNQNKETVFLRLETCSGYQMNHFKAPCDFCDERGFFHRFILFFVVLQVMVTK